ncbi:hypothetical protein [Clostridium kluyveri]|nr:hypothetical protein [Clostridium kluyveri]UZQ51795.1 hypothetical protein OP486_06405 [Clostridium kluyveri]
MIVKVSNILGVGTLLAFPGSIIGAIVAYPMASFLISFALV